MCTFYNYNFNLMAVTNGLSIGWTAPLIPYFLSEASHINMSRDQADWLETCFLIGTFAGMTATFFFLGKIGRRKSLMLALSIVILSWLIIAIASTVECLYVARTLMGFGLDMAIVSASMYISEISHKKYRGFLSCTIHSLSLIGILVIYIVGPFAAYFVPSVIAEILLLIELIVCFFLPDSPYYLLTKKRYSEARESLLRFRNNPSEVELELKEMSAAIETEQENRKFLLKELFVEKSYRKSCIIMIVLNMCHSFSGCDVMLMNLHEILEAAGSIYVNSSTAAILFSAFMLVASILAALTIDQFGRKILMMISSVSAGTCLLAIAIYFNLKYLGYNTDSISWIPVVLVMIYAVVFPLLL